MLEHTANDPVDARQMEVSQILDLNTAGSDSMHHVWDTSSQINTTTGEITFGTAAQVLPKPLNSRRKLDPRPGPESRPRDRSAPGSGAHPWISNSCNRTRRMLRR